MGDRLPKLPIVYIGSQNDYSLNALDASNGKRLWNFTTEFWVMSTPVVAGGLVYFSADKNIYALNAATGDKLWNYSTTVVLSNYGVGVDYEYASPTFANGIVYIYSNREQGLFALKASNGAKLWNYPRTYSNPPIMANGVIYVKHSSDFCALNAYNGKKIWSCNLAHDSSPAFTADDMYFGKDNDFYAFETPISLSTSSSETTLPALTEDGQMVNLTMSWNITTSEVSHAFITTDELTSTIYFTVTGKRDTAGFSNMTIPKGLILNGTIPKLYLDDQVAKNQGYTQDEDNYYVWYATDFSMYQISIVFCAGSQGLEVSSIIIWLGVASATFIIAVTIFIAFYRKRLKA